MKKDEVARKGTKTDRRFRFALRMIVLACQVAVLLIIASKILGVQVIIGATNDEDRIDHLQSLHAEADEAEKHGRFGEAYEIMLVALDSERASLGRTSLVAQSEIVLLVESDEHLCRFYALLDSLQDDECYGRGNDPA